MHIGTVILYALMASASVVLLALIVATGNFSKLFSVVTWLSLDLLVTVLGTVLVTLPVYRQSYFPALFHFHTVAFALCLVWMAVDAWRGAHPASGVFFWGFMAYGASRLFQYLLYRAGGSYTVIEAINTFTWALIIGVMIAALLLPIPPDVANQKDIEFSPVTGAPVPMLAQQGQR